QATPNLSEQKPLFTAHDPLSLQLEPVQLGRLPSAPQGGHWAYLSAGAPSRSGPHVTSLRRLAEPPSQQVSISSERKQIPVVLPSISPGEAGEMAWT
ncbi:hypothetical protein P7K49_032406, partial [Saguinus oedipus]